jgi:hypothetical protein
MDSPEGEWGKLIKQPVQRLPVCSGTRVLRMRVRRFTPELGWAVCWPIAISVQVCYRNRLPTWDRLYYWMTNIKESTVHVMFSIIHFVVYFMTRFQRLKLRIFDWGVIWSGYCDGWGRKWSRTVSNAFLEFSWSIWDTNNSAKAADIWQRFESETSLMESGILYCALFVTVYCKDTVAAV